MSRGPAIRLGPLPSTDSVKLTVALPAELKADLDRYAEVHTRTWGTPVDAATLVPHIVAAFLARDRGFKKARTAGARAGAGRAGEAPASG
jgi:hypothetical protein